MSSVESTIRPNSKSPAAPQANVAPGDRDPATRFVLRLDAALADRLKLENFRPTPEQRRKGVLVEAIAIKFNPRDPSGRVSLLVHDSRKLHGMKMVRTGLPADKVRAAKTLAAGTPSGIIEATGKALSGTKVASRIQQDGFDSLSRAVNFHASQKSSLKALHRPILGPKPGQ